MKAPSLLKNLFSKKVGLLILVYLLIAAAMGAVCFWVPPRSEAAFWALFAFVWFGCEFALIHLSSDPTP